MSSTAYQLMPFDGIFSGSKQGLGLVRDGALGDENWVVRAHVQSDDYIITLATELEKLAQGMNSSNKAEAAVLETFVKELLYIDQHYQVVRK